MKLLVLDGNSILNRAFYGIKLLTTKDGRFTNGIYGFMNIFLRLLEEQKPDAVAVAFDLKAPTFRHKMYSEYKAGRKGMPEELAQQMPVLKELLCALGYKTVEKEGWEADDILGTLSKKCPADCVIATGDRDSLQLVSNDTTVLLAATKMGRPVTTIYTPEKIIEEYGVEPRMLIDIKALMGDSSDNIPGVAGIGQKTAGELVSRFGGIDNIYNKIDELDIKQSVRDKLLNGRESAYLSRELGTISFDAPVSLDVNDYLREQPDVRKVTEILTGLEMFSTLEKLNLKPTDVQRAEKKEPAQIPVSEENDYDALYARLKAAGEAYFTTQYDGGYASKIFFAEKEQISFICCGMLSFPLFMKSFLEDAEIKKYTSDTKQLFSYALRNNILPAAVEFDTMLAGYVLNPSASDYSETRLAQEYSVTLPCVSDEAAGAAVMQSLCERLVGKIAENGQESLLYNIEMPLARVLASMELAGFEVDEVGITEFGEMLDEKISALVSAIYAETGFEFNINSPKQLGEALFEKMGIPAKKKTKSGYSTNADVLEGLSEEYPVVGKILEYRTYTKLKSTYCDGLLKVIAPDGRIHSTLNQTETRTGRISSTEPNLQNIPVRTELGSRMRRFFRAKEGCVLVDADYSQIELRVLSHIADDKVMLEAFNNGDDIHTITASQVFGMPLNMVTGLMRSRAKAVNFGIVYGIGAFSLAKDIGVSRAEADRYIKGYLSHYSGVNAYMEDVVKTAKQDGFVGTLFGRRRYLPELSASNGMLRAFGERVARNMPIQGTAADIIKIAMIRVCDRLRSEGLSARLIMQIHDELIVETPESEKDRVSVILKEEMENAAQLKVKLLADVHCGKTWYDAKG